MTQPTYAQARALLGGGGLTSDTLAERVLSVLAMLASGQNPDGTPFSLLTSATISSGVVEVSNDVGNPLPVNGTVEVTNDVGNALPVTDQRLAAPAALTDAFADPTTAQVGAFNLWYNGTAWDRSRTPNVFKTVTATNSGNTALWTPTSGKKFRLMAALLQITGDATISGGGDLDIKLQDSAASIPAAALSVFCPAVSAALLGGFTSPWMTYGNGVLSTAANNVLNLNLSATLSGGKARAVVMGTEE